ncbi:MAG TPA: Gfo/Idh/MocA family oxidoreductase, partial [Caulobacter sp.]|nr:Gfo/Idh/MocA family oxidoreductase [Caulobacter sp.]
MARDSAVSEKRPLRVGVTGIGVMGSNHARVLAELPGAELVAIADPDQAQAARVAQFLGCQAVGDHNDLLALGLDAVIVAAPTHLHHPIALDVINAGCSVLVEKPVASTVEQGREIVSLARTKGVTLMIGHVE